MWYIGTIEHVGMREGKLQWRLEGRGKDKWAFVQTTNNNITNNSG